MLAVNPGNAVAHSNLGCVLADLAEFEEAEDHLRRAIALRPGFADAYSNFAYLMINQRRYEDAEQFARKCISLDPRHFNGWLNLGWAARAQVKAVEAKECFQQATLIAPDSARAWALLGDAHIINLELIPAKECFERALALDKDSAAAHVGLGVVFANFRAYGQSIVSILRGLGSDFRNINAWMNLGAALNSQGRADAAKQAYQKAGELGSVAAKLKLATVVPWIVSSNDEITRRHTGVINELKSLLTDPTLALSDPLLEVNFTNFQTGYYGLNEIEINRAVAQAFLKACPKLDWTAPHCETWKKPNKLRIGVITAFTKDHIVAELYQAIYKFLDRDRFEVIAFAPPRRFQSPVGKAAEPVPCVGLPPTVFDARKVVADACLDLMFYLDTFVDPFIYYLAFARLAPIQCTTWGHPITTGLPYMDYYISAQDWESEDADTHYTERLIRLPELPMYFSPPPVPDKPIDRARYGIPPAAKVYTCLQSLFKLHPDFDYALGGLLRRDPMGIVALLTGEDANWNTIFAERFRQTFPDVIERLVFVPRLSRKEYFAFLMASDAILDPFHWGGGNTTIEALACGVPVPTLPAAYLRGRLTLGFYRKMDLPELIAKDAEEFIELNYRIANDLDFRSALNAKIAQRLPRVYHNRAAISELERFLLNAVEAKATGRSL